jgi:hypothetical protein
VEHIVNDEVIKMNIRMDSIGDEQEIDSDSVGMISIDSEDEDSDENIENTAALKIQQWWICSAYPRVYASNTIKYWLQYCLRKKKSFRF